MNLVPTHSHARLLLTPLAALAVLVAGCGGSPDAAEPSSDGTGAAPAASAAAEPSPAMAPPSTSPDPAATQPATEVEEAVITIEDFEYEVPDAVPAGAEVQVRNEDAEAHTVTLKGSGVQVVVQGRSTATFTAPAAGSYPVGCDFHGSMTATLVVA